MLRTKLRITRMAALAVLLAFAFSTLAVARDHDDDSYYGNSTQARQYGYQNGYRDGFRHGQHERAENDPYDFRSRDWDRASNGYAGWMGSFGQFKDAYRDGYRQGYEAAFYGNVGVPRGYRDDHYFQRDDYRYGQPGFAGNVAYNFGYQDGAAVAREDVYKNKPFNPNPRGKYDDEDRGYHREYGDKNVYRADYGNGYRAGYQASFRRY